MSLRRLCPLLFLLLLSGLAPLVGPGVARADDPESPWADLPHLQEVLAQACDAVEKACHASFTARPTIRISTPEEVLSVLDEELAPLLEDAGGAQMKAALQALSHGLLAKTEPGSNTIHVIPENVRRIAMLLDVPALDEDAVLRVVVAHETAHALDFQRFPALDARRTSTGSAEARQAAGAVIEGHAQFVSKRIAAAWGLSDAWDVYTKAITQNVPGADEGAKLLGNVVAAEMEFTYHQGYRFFEVVQEKAGRRGVERALASPPTQTRMIERPLIWLGQAQAPERIDLVALLQPAGEALEAHVGTPQWNRLLEAQMRAQLSVLTPEETRRVMALYDDAEVVAASNGEGRYGVAIALIALRSRAAARAWLYAEQLIGLRKDAALVEGPARIEGSHYEKIEMEGVDAGLQMSKTVVTATSSQEVVTQIFAKGAFAIELSLIGAPEDLLAPMREALKKVLASL